jgi:hypothetical protein
MKRCQDCKHFGSVRSEANYYDEYTLALISCDWMRGKLPVSLRQVESERLLVDDDAAEDCACYEEKVKG